MKLAHTQLHRQNISDTKAKAYDICNLHTYMYNVGGNTYIHIHILEYRNFSSQL